MAMRSGAVFGFVRSGIGRALQTLFSGVSSEAIPERMTELLKQLDQPATGAKSFAGDGAKADKNCKNTK
jgi:hypothetical protein